jgi:putative restriction endonuclease
MDDMRGVLAITDWEWFQFLRAQAELDEVNFWRPSDLRKPHLDSGTPFIFKLNEKHGGYVVGFGVFASHSVQPMWMAWDAFEERNGAASRAQFHALLAAHRRGHGLESSPTGDYPIGCVMLSSPVFFARADWIRPPSDWARNIVQGKTYDLDTGEGARIWGLCRSVAQAGARTALAGAAVAESSGPRYGQPVLVRPRLGQGTFRIAVTDAYGRACAVTTEHSLPVLEAAHIRPYADDGPHEISNGLLLRTDIHRLFDMGYVTVTPDDHRFVVSRRLKEEYENGRTYYAMHGAPIHLPQLAADYPSREHLEWHARERFRS